MRPSWLIAIVVLLLPLGGCFADQEQQLASCKLEAMRLYPGEELTSYSVVSTKLTDYVETCMKVHGYNFSASSTWCRSYISAFQSNPYCYVPASWIGRLIYRPEIGDQG
jgi:hypothetical protein